MIAGVLRISWLCLKRDRIAQGLTFILPIVFYSIFALIFGSMSSRGALTAKVRLAVVNEDGTPASARFVAALRAEPALRVNSDTTGLPEEPPSREEAVARVRAGKAPVALIIPKGFGERFGAFGPDAAGVDLIADTADPIAGQLVSGLLQRAALTAAPDLVMQRGVALLERHGGALTDAQRSAIEFAQRQLLGAAMDPASAAAAEGNAATTFSGPVRVNMVDVLGEKKKAPAISYYAAATAVMFLLFSMTGGGGILLEEEENSVLERLLATNLTMGTLLVGKWIFLVAMACVQVTLMFVWGALVFGLELFSPQKLAGFAAMTLLTSAAAASFGLLLATACRTRAQLNGVATIVILVMSALGGSMIPRFIMSEEMKQIGLFTFNAWALDGYQKIFWRDETLFDLGPQALVLSSVAVVGLLVARLLARRWETI